MTEKIQKFLFVVSEVSFKGNIFFLHTRWGKNVERRENTVALLIS